MKNNRLIFFMFVVVTNGAGNVYAVKPDKAKVIDQGGFLKKQIMSRRSLKKKLKKDWQVQSSGWSKTTLKI